MTFVVLVLEVIDSILLKFLEFNLDCQPAVDPASKNPQNLSNELTLKFLTDSTAQSKFLNASSLANIISSKEIESYCTIYLCGGHGCIDDYYQNNDIKRAVEYIYGVKKGCVAAICHGPLGLYSCNFNNKPLLNGKFVAAFSNEEEEELGLLNILPILTEQKMDEIGAICVPAQPWFFINLYLLIFICFLGKLIVLLMEE